MPERLTPRDQRRRLDSLQERLLNSASVARDCATKHKAQSFRRSVAVRIRRAIALGHGTSFQTLRIYRF